MPHAASSLPRIVLFSLALATALAGCDHADTVAGPVRAPTPVPTVSPAPLATGTYSGHGTFTWVSIDASRPLCSAITGQIGHSWGLYVRIVIDESSVRVGLGEDPSELALLEGTLAGQTVTASGNPGGAFACPQDPSPTRQVSSELTATLSADRISGEWTDTYGTGADAVAAHFRFDASLVRQ
jgi:hypothetical protein